MNREPRIVVAATFTAEPLKDSLGFWIRELGIPARIDFAPYNQVFQQLLDPSSIVSTNQNGINIVLIGLEDWQGGDSDKETTGGDAACHAIERNIRDFVSALSEALRRATAPYLVCLCPASPLPADDPGRALALEQAEALLCAKLAEIDSVWTITQAELAAAYPVPDYYDAYGAKFAHIPFTPVYFTALGTMLARRIYALKSSPYKVIVLDCDQTLWSGVCGEDGPSGIRIDVPRRALQEFMVRQHDAGMLLCLCSKNNEEDVIRVFEARPGMPLRQEHIVSRRINWKPKSANLISLAEELQLGLDSFIFIDDDPVECAEVRANCPQVLTVEIPRDAEGIPRFLDHIWAFDHLKITEEGKKRTVLYRENAQREELRRKFFTVGDFLAELGLKIDISPLTPHQLARASELTQRTNQFNLTTIPRSEAELRRVQQEERLEAVAVHVKDRFGDYGLVGFILFQADFEAISVDTFLLSCRALGRGVEHRMLARVGQIALDRGLKRVDARLIPSGKNQPAIDFMDAVGAKFCDPGEGGLVFRFPAQWAAALTFRPDDRGPQSDNEGEQRTGSLAIPDAYPIEAVERCRLLLRIATELSGFDQIHATILSQDRHSRPNLETRFVAPRDANEAAVENIWCEVLNVERAGVWDNFFELGGDSLAMTRVVSRIRQSFGVELSAGAFFNAPTIAGIAQAIAADSNVFGNAAASIEQLLGELSRLSEEDATAQLEGERFGVGYDGPRFGETVTGSGSHFTGPHDTLVSRRFGGLPSVGPTPTPVGPGIASVSIMTHNRLRALERALMSYVENARTHGRNHEFVVIDDPEIEEVEIRTRSMLRDLERRCGVEILYAGRREKSRFAKELTAAGGLPADIVNFALFDVERCGNAYGVSRNALLLDSIGKAVFTADDDTVCRIATAPTPAAGMRFAREWDPADIWFFPDRDSALRSVRFVDEDVLAVHERLLGGDVVSLLGGSGNGSKPGVSVPDLSCANSPQRTRGRVLATFNGLVGDCAWGAPFGDWGGPMGCLLLNDESHGRLVRSEADYRTACTTREILRVVDRPTISGESLCMTVFMALDNRELLPPFLPVKRGEDIVFGLTLRRCIAGGHIGQLPRALVHAPVERRAFSRGELFRSASGFDTAKLMIGCVKSYGEDLARTDAKEGLRALGGHLVELASVPAHGFQETVRDQILKSTESFIAMMASRLQAWNGLPRFWADDVERYMDRLGKAIIRPDYCVPLDLLNGRNDDEARALGQRLVLKFGELLRWWPDIAETARELRTRGQRLAKPVGLD